MSCPSGSIKVTRVLVVDDNENNLLVMESMLRPNGFQVEMVRSGEECLRVLSARIGTADVPDVAGAVSVRLLSTGVKLARCPAICTLNSIP
jgi:CheY-like chemotaxis protein